MNTLKTETRNDELKCKWRNVRRLHKTDLDQKVYDELCNNKLEQKL